MSTSIQYFVSNSVQNVWRMLVVQSVGAKADHVVEGLDKMIAQLGDIHT